MMTVKEVSEKTGVSARTLHYYDQIGLLKPDETTQAGYRLYSHENLKRLQEILLLRELEFPLKAIARILDDPGVDKAAAMEQQIRLLTMKRNRLSVLAQGISDSVPGFHKMMYAVVRRQETM